MKCFSVKEMALGTKNLSFFGIFLVSRTSAQWNQENFVKSTKKAAARREKTGTRHERQYFGLQL